MERSPWLTIWTEPRATIAQIVAHQPNRSLWLLGAIYGFCSLMNLFQAAEIGEVMKTGPALILVILLAPIWGYVNFSVWSWFVRWVGKCLKGQGSFAALRAAYAWSAVPLIVNVPLWLLMVVLFGHQLFLNFSDSYLFTNSQRLVIFLFLITKVIVSIWSLVIYLNALAEVQKFSILKAIFNVLLTGALLVVLTLVVWNFFFWIFGADNIAVMTIYKLM